MKRLYSCLALLLIAAAVCAVLPSAQRAAAPSADTAPSGGSHAQTALPSAASSGESLLFPGLNADAVTAISISAQERSFDFLCRDAGRVSVNGHSADSEIFRTLVAQIAEIPVTPASPAPDSSAPLLHLTITAGGAQYHASFFGQDGSPVALVRSGSHGSWHRTEGWRIGTLMLACEGARIEDIL